MYGAEATAQSHLVYVRGDSEEKRVFKATNRSPTKKWFFYLAKLNLTSQFLLDRIGHEH